jgi:hypothetical protein
VLFCNVAVSRRLVAAAHPNREALKLWRIIAGDFHEPRSSVGFDAVEGEGLEGVEGVEGVEGSS